MAKAPNAPLLMKLRDAAAYLGLSTSFLNKRRVYGGGPKYVKLGGRVAYRKEDLDEWVNSRVRESTSDY